MVTPFLTNPFVLYGLSEILRKTVSELDPSLITTPPPAETVTITPQQAKILEANLAKLLLLCETLWELIKEKHGLSEADLLKKLSEVDLRDGTLDGKNQRKAIQCPACHRMVSQRHHACIYCGKLIDYSLFTL